MLGLFAIPFASFEDMALLVEPMTLKFKFLTAML